MKEDAEAIDYEADRPDDDGFVDNENGDVSGGPDKALEAQTEREIRQEIEEASERKRGEIGVSGSSSGMSVSAASCLLHNRSRSHVPASSFRSGGSRTCLAERQA